MSLLGRLNAQAAAQRRAASPSPTTKAAATTTKAATGTAKAATGTAKAAATTTKAVAGTAKAVATTMTEEATSTSVNAAATTSKLSAIAADAVNSASLPQSPATSTSVSSTTSSTTSFAAKPSATKTAFSKYAKPAQSTLSSRMGQTDRQAMPEQASSGQKSERITPSTPANAGKAARDASADRVKENIHREVASILARREDQGREVDLDQLIEEVMDESPDEISRKERTRIHRDVLDEVNGLGPLEQLLHDPSISEIMVNGPDMVFVERKGHLELSGVTFDDDAHVRRIIDRIVSPLGRHIDDSNPMVDARLADGSRVNAVIPPISLCGPSLTIRKFSDTPLTVENLIGFGSLTPDMAGFLEAAVLGKLNILVSGGTGSGKTTLLNVLSAFIPADERIVTIEDAAELRLMQDHVVPMESRPSNLEGSGAITIRDLVRNALRMRPDRIIVGEVRGGETLDMLQAMNTGHDGSLTTAHANSPRDALARIETMVMMAGMDLPITAIRSQVAGALDLIVQQARLRDGSRKITSICEVIGMEGDIITTQEIFRFHNNGFGEDGKIVGTFASCGIRPACAQKMMDNGATLYNEWFSVGEEGLR